MSCRYCFTLPLHAAATDADVDYAACQFLHDADAITPCYAMIFAMLEIFIIFDATTLSYVITATRMPPLYDIIAINSAIIDASMLEMFHFAIIFF